MQNDSPRHQPPIIYLDTQDWSRFGDVIRGRADTATGRLFEQFQRIEDRGEATFVYSLPILSELLQWDPAYPETTMAKAEAVERLCGENAFVWPARLVAIEAAGAASRLGLAPPPNVLPVSSTSEWFPSMAGSLSDIRNTFEEQLDQAIARAGQLNRATPRKLRARARRLKQLELARSAVPEFAALHGFREADVNRSIIALIASRIDPDEASRRLFGMIAKPTRFVDHYFRNQDGEKDLPRWMSRPGAKVAAGLASSRAKLAALGAGPGDRLSISPAAREAIADIGKAIVHFAHTAAAGVNLDLDVLQHIEAAPATLALMPCYRVVTSYLDTFMQKNLGLEDIAGNFPEDSAMGDVMHALYLPRADIWRGDRRFSHLLKSKVPEFASRVASKVGDIPVMLEKRDGLDHHNRASAGQP
jgi:hypothetical protein